MDITQKPFHEVVIDALLEADENKLRDIAWWLMRTALPHGTHERVRKAWFKRCYEIKFEDHALIIEVTSHLSEQERSSVHPYLQSSGAGWD